MSCTRTFKDTFWSRKRVENNITVVELSKLVKCSRATTGAYFTGFLMPSDDTIKILCDFFDVDFIQGKREFINAHKKYDVDYKRVVVAKAHSPKEKKEKQVKTKEQVTTEPKKEKGMNNAEKVREIEKLLYNSKVPYEFFIKIKQTPFDKLEETLYSEVDYTVYKTAERILSGDVVKVENFDKWNIQ